MKILKIFALFILVVFFYACTATDTTEQSTTDQTVQYSTPPKDQVTSTNSVTQETTAGKNGLPEYIPQGPTTPPPAIKQEYGETQEPEVKVTPPVEEKVEPVKVEEYLYKVQVFASKSKLNAENQLKIVKNRLPNQTIKVEKENDLFKVRMGSYSKWEHAKQMKDAVYNLGYTDSFIVTEIKK